MLWLNTWHYGRSFPMTMGLPRHSWFSNLEEAANNSCQFTAHQLIIPAMHFMSVVCKYCQWSHMGRLSIHMGWQSACRFCGISCGSGCENLVYLFIFKHLWVHAVKLNEHIVKQLKGVSTLCWNLMVANPPRNGPYIKITKCGDETFVYVCYRHGGGGIM